LDYAENACEMFLARAPDAAKSIREITRSAGLQPADWLYDIVNGANDCKSVRDTRELGRRLENQLLDAMAVNPRCDGVTVIRDPHPKYDAGWLAKNSRNDKIKQQNLYWNLHLDYRPGEKEYSWALFPNKPGGDSNGPLVEGEGATPKVADQICTVVTRRGAAIR